MSEPSVATTVHIQYVWSPRYIDSPVLRDRDTTTGGDWGGSGSGLDERLYYLTDANANVTAVVNTSGEAVERYAYDPYGEVTILNGASGVDADVSGGVTEWDADADGASDVANEILYCGYRYDPETGFYHVRNRMYHPTLGRWTQRDPLGYVDGMSVYQYADGRPLNAIDPSGLQKTEAKKETTPDVPDNTNRDDKPFAHLKDPLADNAMAWGKKVLNKWREKYGEDFLRLREYDTSLRFWTGKKDSQGKVRQYNKYDDAFVAAAIWWIYDGLNLDSDAVQKRAWCNRDAITNLAELAKAISYSESGVGYGSGFNNRGRYPKQNPRFVDTEDVMQVGDPADLTVAKKVQEINKQTRGAVDNDLDDLKGTPGELDYKNITGEQSIFYGIGWFLRKLQIAGVEQKEQLFCQKDACLQKALELYNGSPTKDAYSKATWQLYKDGTWFNPKTKSTSPMQVTVEEEKV